MTTGKNINIALIGYGFVGKTFHAPLIQSVDGLNLAIVASRDEDKVKRDLPDVTVIASPEEAIQHPDVDLVVIASLTQPISACPSGFTRRQARRRRQTLYPRYAGGSRTDCPRGRETAGAVGIP